MERRIRLVGRGSRLSMLQMQLVSKKINLLYPDVKVELITRTSRGDQLQNVPLQTVEGSDFFTQEIFDELAKGDADIAVHSLKDMSAHHFFGGNVFGVPDRDDTRDVVFFHPDVEEKIRTGIPIEVGTCSPRREAMALDFLEKALPFFGKQPIVKVKFIRGNVDSRFKKLANKEYDAIILATAGVNRLLQDEIYGKDFANLIAPFRKMFLPLVECVPAPCQGAIVVEAIATNTWAAAIVNAINEPHLMEQCVLEKKTALLYGSGCNQPFGVTTLLHNAGSTLYAGGINTNNDAFTSWYGLPSIDISKGKLFAATDHMKQFFKYQYLNGDKFEINSSVAFIANYKAVHHPNQVSMLAPKRIFVSGTKTWLQVAKMGLWVEGSADALGLNTMLPFWSRKIVDINKADVTIITGTPSNLHWEQEGWKTCATYILQENIDATIISEVSNATHIFWTSSHQYHALKTFIAENIHHICPSGETATLLKKEGLTVTVFPSIKSFVAWRKNLAN